MPISSIVEAALVPSQLLGELFVEKGLITHDELNLALEEQQVEGKRLGEILVKKGFVSGPALTTVLAEQLGVEMETQQGFGSGLWSEIKRRHPRGQADDREERQVAADESGPAVEPRLAVIDGMLDVEEHERATGAGGLDDELQNLRQQLSFAAQRLDEERAAHEGTQCLLEDARTEAEAQSREAEEWRERAARAEDAGYETQASRTDLAELNGVVTDLRVELAARDEALQHAAEAQAEVAVDLDRLQAELNDLRESRTKGEDHLTVLMKQLEDERAKHHETHDLLDKARLEAAELASAVAELRTELAAREEALQRDTEAESELEAELARLQETSSTVAKQLEDERAAHEAVQQLVEASRSETVELDVAVTRLRAELVRRDAVEAEHAEQLRALRDELAARDAARDREADARVETEAEVAKLRAETLALQQRLDDERTESVASRREVGRLESQLSEMGPVNELIAEAERELAAKTEELEHARELLAGRGAASPVAEVVAGHVVFRPGSGGYELAERPGPAPEVGTVEDFDGDRYLVTRIGSSPLPADRRRCAYLEV